MFLRYAFLINVNCSRPVMLRFMSALPLLFTCRCEIVDLSGKIGRTNYCYPDQKHLTMSIPCAFIKYD